MVPDAVKPPSLAPRLLLRLALGLAAVLALALALAYSLGLGRFKDAAGVSLLAQVRERAARESQAFLVLTAAQARLRSEIQRSPTGSDPAELLARFAPLWPEPADPVSLLQPEALPAEAGWSAPRFDSLTRRWSMGLVSPLAPTEGRVPLRLHSVMVLDALLARLEREPLPGSMLMIVSDDGQLIAHPVHRPALAQARSSLPVDQMDDPALSALYRRLRDAVRTTPGPLLLPDGGSGALVAAARIEGPGWWLLAVQPSAHWAIDARVLVAWGLGLGALAVLGVVVWLGWQLRRRVLIPLQRCEDAAVALGGGDSARVAAGALRLPEGRDDEIGRLARALRQTAQQVDEAALQLAQRTESLRVAQTELHAAHERVEDAQQALHIQHHALVDAYDALDRQGQTDSLSHLGDRMALEERLKRMVLALGERRAQPPRHAFVCIGLDHFQSIRQQHGAHAGDLALGAVATRLALGQREGDLLVRWGETEFLLLIRAEDEGAGSACAERLRAAVARQPVPLPEAAALGLSVSIGHAAWPASAPAHAPLQRWQDALALAEAALAEARAAGGNRCVAAACPGQEPLAG